MSINVSKPYLPPLSMYSEHLEGIWNRNWSTNNGPLVNMLEKQLTEYLESQACKICCQWHCCSSDCYKSAGDAGGSDN